MSEPKEAGLPEAEDDPNEVENAWAIEVERRRREVREGRVELMRGDEVRERLDGWRPTST